MSWGGHALDMVRRMQVNRDLVLDRRQRTKKAKEAYQDSDAAYGRELNLESNLSESEQAELLRTIRESKKAQLFSFRWKSFLVTILIVASVVIALKLFLPE